VGFPDKLDGEDEVVYGLARELVFGDFHYPVVHEGMGVGWGVLWGVDYRDPSVVQRDVERQSRLFFADLEAAPREYVSG
jgi:hypothetical protein